MRLDQQVCPLKLAQRLKELGVAQTARFSWWYVGGPDEYQVATQFEMHTAKLRMDEEHERDPNFPTIYPAKECAAFTVAELGLLLEPRGFRSGSSEVRREDSTRYFAVATYVRDPVIYGRTEAEARALLLIALLVRSELVAAELTLGESE